MAGRGREAHRDASTPQWRFASRVVTAPLSMTEDTFGVRMTMPSTVCHAERSGEDRRSSPRSRSIPAVIPAAVLCLAASGGTTPMPDPSTGDCGARTRQFSLAGGPPLDVVARTTTTEGAPSLRTLQGWVGSTYIHSLFLRHGSRSLPPTLSQRTRKDGAPSSGMGYR
jgi:hypothetical protein